MFKFLIFGFVALQHVYAFDEGFYKALSHKEFPWMNKQIQEDFSYFETSKITQQGIDEAYRRACDQIFSHPANHITMRFRTINGKIYLYTKDKNNDPGTFYFLGKNWEHVVGYLSHLSRRGDLPDVDFIYVNADGVPESYHNQVFLWNPIKEANPPAPILARAKPRENGKGIIAVPDTDILWSASGHIFSMVAAAPASPWATKKNMAVWRGSTSDLQINHPVAYGAAYIVQEYSKRARYQTCMASKLHPDFVDAGYTAVHSHAPGLVDFVKDLLKGGMSPGEQMNYKYILILDGWSCTYPAYISRLASNSVVFKQNSHNIQWFYDALIPYVHYVPINYDASNFIEMVDWARRNDEKCMEIAENATDFAVNNLRSEHNFHYLKLVLEKYNSLQNFDLPSLDEEMKLSSDWMCVFSD